MDKEKTAIYPLVLLTMSLPIILSSDTIPSRDFEMIWAWNTSLAENIMSTVMYAYLHQGLVLFYVMK